MSKKILIVDHEKKLVNVVGRYLVQAGFGVVTSGRYDDAYREPIPSAIIDLYRAEEPTKFYLETAT